MCFDGGVDKYKEMAESETNGQSIHTSRKNIKVEEQRMWQ